MHREGIGYGYRYDAAGNRLNRVLHDGSPARDASLADNFLYDADGRMFRDSSKSLRLEYDGALDRPYKFTVADGSGDPVTAWYMAYDAGGNRVAKMEYEQDENWLRTKSYFSNGVEIRDTTGDTEILVSLDGYGRMTQGPFGAQFEMYVKNHLGSTVKIYREGDEIYRADYEPYGKLRLDSTSNDPLPVTQKFTGKELDAGIDLTQFPARMYDQDLGVWTSPDPKQQFASAYSYAGNGTNPISGVDADGLELSPVTLPGLSNKGTAQNQTFYVDATIASNMTSFMADAHQAYPRLTVNNTFRLENSSSISTENTRAKGLSRHQAGFAIDINGVRTLASKELANLNSMAAKYGFSPLNNQQSDMPHFSANPVDYGYPSLGAAVSENRQSFFDLTEDPCRY